MCKTEEKIKKIIFYKFIYLGVLENEKKKIYMYINFWCFPVEEMKKNVWKNEKKRCRKGLGYCPTVSQYNEKLYCDTTGFGSAKCLESVSQYNHCIVAWWARRQLGWKLYYNLRLLGSSVLQHVAVGLQGVCVAIHQVYCDRRGLGYRSVSQYTSLYCGT